MKVEAMEKNIWRNDPMEWKESERESQKGVGPLTIFLLSLCSLYIEIHIQYFEKGIVEVVKC